MAAVERAVEGRFGRLVTFTLTQIGSVPIAEAVGHLRTVPLDGGFVQGARSLGVCLGD